MNMLVRTVPESETPAPAPPRSLLIGCGNSRIKKVRLDSQPDWIGQLTTLDMDPNCGADVLWTMDGTGPDKPLPFPDETFDEIGAYDVLEHWGAQGDWRAFFDEFSEYWRILKPGGRFGIIVPINGDALADPGHTRFFHQNYFGFLDQAFYADNLAKGAACTDYRWYWRRCFKIELLDSSSGHHLVVMLRKA